MERSYNQFCPVAMAAEVLCSRWTVVLLRELLAGSTRFNDLRRGLPRMSPALLSQRADPAAAARDDLVRVGLMADVPDQAVLRRIEDVVQRHRKLDDAQSRAQMAAGHRNGRNRLLTQLVGKLAQLVGAQTTDVGRNVDGIEKRRRTLPSH